MSDPRGWKKHEDVIEAAKKELLEELGLLGDKVTLDKIYELLEQGMTAQCVKSVQMQSVNQTFVSNSGITKTFDISEVNDRAIAFATITSRSQDAGAYQIKELTSTSVKVYMPYATNSAYSAYITLFVIEFY